MATEVKLPTEDSTERPIGQSVGNSGQLFWNKEGKIIIYAVVIIILLVAGWLAYKSFIVEPKEKKAAEAMWKAEEYYRMDSARLALNGDGTNQGFLKIISNYGGTDAGNLSKFYAGSSYLKIGDFANAVKYLEDFKTSDKIIQLRATGLLADAYAEQGKKAEAADQYKKAGTMYTDDNYNSPEYLFRAGLLYQELGKNKDAIEVFNTIRQKYPNTQRGREVEKYLARLGVFE